ncbi:MAG: protein kinase [Pirellulaceae bacterium]|nr:protein kinase [Pirellulaceae bacterium]
MDNPLSFGPAEPPSLQALADTLLDAWETAEVAPALGDYLQRASHLRPADLVQLCLIDQRQRWRRNAPLRIHDYLVLCPAIAHDQGLLLDLLYGEIRTRRELGEQPEIEVYLSGFPELRDRLQDQLAVGMWMESACGVAEFPRSSVTVRSEKNKGEFGPYILESVIAHGGMGVIYRARHRTLDRVVALKMIRLDRLAREADHRRFHNESMTSAHLEHPNIVPILDVGEENGVHYFTMKLLPGGDLQQQAGGFRTDPFAAARLMATVVDAVAYAHSRGVLHRDLKPSNVLLDCDGIPYVTDFGLALRLDDESNLTRTGELLGTPAFLAPECLSYDRQPFTVAADVYGLGAVLYFLLTGRPPFAETNLVELLHEIRDREPPAPRLLNPRVDRDLEQICLKALEKRPEQRYLSAGALAYDLRRYLDGESILARPRGWFERRLRWVRRHPDLAAFSGVGVLLATLFISLLAWQSWRLGRLHQAEQQALVDARLAKSEAEAMHEDALEQRRLARETAYATAIHRADFALRSDDLVQFSHLLDMWQPADAADDPRNLEWFFLDRQYRPRAERLTTSQGPVRSVQFSPDGRLVASAGEAGPVELIDLNSRKTVSFDSPATVRDLSFAPDGQCLAAACDDGRVRLYSLNGAETKTLSVAADRVWQVQFVGQGDQILTCAEDGVVRLVNVGDGSLSASFCGQQPANCCQISADNQWIVTGHRDGELRIWDLANQTMVYEFSCGVLRQIKSLAVSPSGNLLACGNSDMLLQVCRITRPWSHEWIFTGRHYDRIQQVRFSPDEKFVAGCDKNGGLRVWQLDKQAAPGGSALRFNWQAHEGRAYALDFHPERELLASGGQENHVATWHLVDRSGQRTLGKEHQESAIPRTSAFSSDNSTVAIACENGVELWNVSNGVPVSRVAEDSSPMDHVAFSPDGSYVAASNDRGRLLKVYRRLGTRYRLVWSLTDQAADQLVFSPTSDLLAISSWTDSRVVVYRVADGGVEQRISANQAWSVGFSPDSSQLAFVVEDNLVIWDWIRRVPLRTLSGHTSTATSLAYSPDGRWLASGSNDRRVILWDAATGRKIHEMLGHSSYVQQVAFAGNERLLSLSDTGTVLVWHVELGTELCRLREDPVDRCFRIAVSPDQRWLACRVANGLVQLLELGRSPSEDH